MTNDGNCILREIDVAHPGARSLLDISRAQDEECGDGTTSVIILAGEMLIVSEQFLVRNMHPKIITTAYMTALNDAMECVKALAFPINVHDKEQMTKLIASSIGTKFTHRWGDLMCRLALEAVLSVTVDRPGQDKEIDIKRYAKVEKIPGGELGDSEVLRGVMINKDIIHPRMRRRIVNPRVLLLDCPLEYKKAESQTNVEIKNEEDWDLILKIEEEAIAKMCEDIIAFKPDVVVTEKGLSDLAQHHLLKHNISAIRRLRKTDNNRIARATGATIVNRTEEIDEKDIGTNCGLFEVKKIGDDYFAYFVECKDPKACTILLRGPSKDLLNEVERNLQDAMNVARNIIYDPRLLPGGGATEMEIASFLRAKSATIPGVQQWPYRTLADAFEVIPRTLLQNCGADVVRRITELRAKHATPGANTTWGVDGNKGTLADMKELGIWEPYLVRTQVFKSATEACTMLLRVDAIVSGIRKGKKGGNAGPSAQEQMAGMEGGEDDGHGH
jgi:T-complex protein 1 subunit gamma